LCINCIMVRALYGYLFQYYLDPQASFDILNHYKKVHGEVFICGSTFRGAWRRGHIVCFERLSIPSQKCVVVGGRQEQRYLMPCWISLDTFGWTVDYTRPARWARPRWEVNHVPLTSMPHHESSSVNLAVFISSHHVCILQTLYTSLPIFLKESFSGWQRAANES
jgi:hypothetical protein